MEINVVKILLKKLVEHAGKAIKKSAVQNENSDIIDRSLEEKIIEVFSDLLEEEYDRISFYKQIINNNKLLYKPSAKMIVKLIYKFIYCVMVDGARITTDKIEEHAKEITNMISKLNNRSRFFPFKAIFLQRFFEIKKIKLQCFKKQSDDIQNANLFLDSVIKLIQKSNNLDLKKLDEMIDSLNGYIASVSMFYNKSSIKQAAFFIKLRVFFIQLNNKLKILIKNRDYEKDKENINSLIKNVFTDIKISETYIDVNADLVKCMEECVKSCKLISYYTESDEKKFKNREASRENKAYSFESFQRTLSLNEETIKKANEFLKANNFKAAVSDKLLDEYKKLLENQDDRLQEKSFFDSTVKKITSTVHKEINKQKKSESMFGDKKPTSNQVLNKIVDLF